MTASSLVLLLCSFWFLGRRKICFLFFFSSGKCGCILLLQVEIQVRKLYCVNKALPSLPINIEDAARSEVEIEKALQVIIFICCALLFSNVILEVF